MAWLRRVLLFITILGACGAGVFVLGTVYSAWSNVPATAIAAVSDVVTDIPALVPTHPLPSAPPRDTTASLVFVGDVMLDRHVADRITASHDDAYPFEDMKDDPRFTQADLRAMNLEGPVTTVRRAPNKGEVDFMFDPRFLPVLRNVGFDVVSQANNHGWDQGKIGADDSRQRLSAAGFLVFGDEVRDNFALATSTVRGHRFAFVGFNSVSKPIDDTVADQVMKEARTDADTVIVVPHWGVEYQDHPTDAVKTRARWFIDHGADVVIGGHPHWAQGMEMYHGKPIIYSLGNFVFDQDFSTQTREGLSVRLMFEPHQLKVELNPIQIDASQPHFVDGVERMLRLKTLAAISDPSLSEQIQSGTVTISF